MTFHMVVARRPRSLQATNKKTYQEALAEEARTRMSDQVWLRGELYVRVIWFHTGRTQGDVDNIVKLILDALRGIVYEDDSAITKCLAERVDTTQTFEFAGSPASDIVNDRLLALIADETEEHVLYVEIGTITARRIAFGLIDGA